MSRVFSWVLRAASRIRRRPRAGAYCSCLQEGSRPRHLLATFLGARTRKKALSSIFSQSSTNKWALAPLPANAQLRLPVSACLALFLLIWRLLELPCSGHASLCRWLRAWPPVINRPWQPRPSSKDASEAAEGCPNARAAPQSDDIEGAL